MPSGTRSRGIRTLADLNLPAHDGSGSDSDEPQEYYTGGEKRYPLFLSLSLLFLFEFFLYLFIDVTCLFAKSVVEN